MLSLEMLRLLARPLSHQYAAFRRRWPGLIDVLQRSQFRKNGDGTVDRCACYLCLLGQIGSAQAAIGLGGSSLDKPGKGCAQSGLCLGTDGLHLGATSTRGAINLRIRSRS